MLEGFFAWLGQKAGQAVAQQETDDESEHEAHPALRLPRRREAGKAYMATIDSVN